MTYKMHGALVASLGAVALLLAANQALARSGSAPAAAHAGKFAHRPFAPSLRHHRRHDARAFFPATGSFYEPSIGEPPLDVAQPMSRDMHYTYTYDVPWDWAHRYPPGMTTPEHAPGCPAQIVTVPGRDGTEHTVNIMRCY